MSGDPASPQTGTVDFEASVRSLADAWPRPIIASGRSAEIARWWCQQRAEAIRLGAPPFARVAWTEAQRRVLFEARRARRLCRGLEEAEKILDAQSRGLASAPATHVESEGGRRVSRLLVVSDDGSERFYRQVDRLCQAHAVRLEAIVVECDGGTLGSAIFGEGKVARAVMLDHRDRVVDFLLQLPVG